MEPSGLESVSESVSANVNQMVSLGDTDISLHIRILPNSKLKNTLSAKICLNMIFLGGGGCYPPKVTIQNTLNAKMICLNLNGGGGGGKNSPKVKTQSAKVLTKFSGGDKIPQ